MTDQEPPAIGDTVVVELIGTVEHVLDLGVLVRLGTGQRVAAPADAVTVKVRAADVHRRPS